MCRVKPSLQIPELIAGTRVDLLQFLLGIFELSLQGAALAARKIGTLLRQQCLGFCLLDLALQRISFDDRLPFAGMR